MAGEWEDPGIIQGFGNLTEQDAQVLAKTLSAGESISIPGSQTPGDGYGLKVEDLQQALVVTSFTEEEFVFWRRITKEGAKQTVTQYNRVLSHGEDWGSGVIAEDEAPEDSASTYERVAELIRYFGVKGGVTLPMQLSETVVGENLAHDSSERMLDLIRKIERMLYYGDRNLDAKQINGLKTQMLAQTNSALIIDLKGRLIQKEDITGAMAKVGADPFFGKPNECHMNLEVLEGFNRSLYPKERIILPAPNNLGEVGIAPTSIVTARGNVALVPSTFINDQLPFAPTAAVGNSSKRPNTPQLGGPGAPAAANNASSKFEASDAGDYLYKIAAANRYGRSNSFVMNAVALTVAAGQSVTMGIQANGGPDPMWYEVYRTPKGGAAGKEQLIARVQAQAGGAATTIVDHNAARPGTSSVFLMQNNSKALAFRQLGPLMRILMSVSKPVFEYMLLLFGVLLLKAPNKHVLFLNAGHPTL